MWQTEQQIMSQMDVNYLGALRVTRACFPLLVRTDDERTRVVNMISNCTECPLPTLGPYTGSKVWTDPILIYFDSIVVFTRKIIFIKNLMNCSPISTM